MTRKRLSNRSLNGPQALVPYDIACRALAEAVAVDDVKNILDVAVAMRVLAHRAKNYEAEANAVELRMRATRRLGEMVRAQKETVGLNRGAKGSKVTGLKKNPVMDDRPTLASQGIDKNLAQQARVLGAMDEPAFERKVEDARGSAGRVFRRAVREVEIEQERAERRAQTAKGGSVADLHALAAFGQRFGVIAIDPPWPFQTFSERSGRHVTEHYETMTLDEIKALPVQTLAAKDCALFLWCNWPNMPMWAAVLQAWGFTYSGLAFDWVKLNANGEGLHWGNGYGTRSNPEPCLLAKIGNPLRLDSGVHSVIMTPVGAHSEKPHEAYVRMQKLFGGPYLELFARKERDGWTTWGNECGIPKPKRRNYRRENAANAARHQADERCWRERWKAEAELRRKAGVAP